MSALGVELTEDPPPSRRSWEAVSVVVNEDPVESSDQSCPTTNPPTSSMHTVSRTKIPLSQAVESQRLSAGCATDGGPMVGISPSWGGVGLGRLDCGGGDGTGPDDGRAHRGGSPSGEP